MNNEQSDRSTQVIKELKENLLKLMLSSIVIFGTLLFLPSLIYLILNQGFGLDFWVVVISGPILILILVIYILLKRYVKKQYEPQ